MLATGALVSLVLAILQTSLLWLGVTLAFDLAIAAYITLLLQAKEQRRTAATVVPMRPAERTEEDDQQRTVRVVVGG
jgi:hypothetical protein